jgi:hypothetical protein
MHEKELYLQIEGQLGSKELDQIFQEHSVSTLLGFEGET